MLPLTRVDVVALVSHPSLLIYGTPLHNFRDGIVVDIHEIVNNTNLENDDVFNMIFEIMMKTKREGAERKGFRSLNDLLKEYYEPSTKPRYITTGFKRLDAMLHGLYSQNLIVIATRPNVGKTAWVIKSMLENAKQGHRCGFFSLEQSGLDVTERLISIQSHIPVFELSSKQFYETPNDKIPEAFGELADKKIFIYDATMISLAEMTLEAKRLASTHGLDVIYIDYLDMMKMPEGKENLAYQIGIITRGLRKLAKELNIPVVLLCQTNRDADKRTNKEPLFSDLKGSGAIEQDSDVVIFVDRPDMKTKDGKYANMDWETARFIVAKNRKGPKGEVEVYFVPQTIEFVDEKPDPSTSK